MGGRTPGPVCQESRPVCIDDGTLARVCSPKPGVIKGGTPLNPVTLRTLIFDAEQTLSYLHSVARAKAIERHIKLEWKEYKESKVLNFIYTVLWWKGKPGWVEVDMGDARRIEAETAAETERLLATFFDKAAQGPRPAVQFLEAQERIRASCLEGVGHIFQEAQSINREVIGEAARGIKNLAVIKCSATIALKGAALAGAGLPGFLVSLGYDVATDVIKDWDKASDAELIGVATKKAAVESGKEVVQQAAEHMEKIYEGEASAPSRQAEWLAKRLEETEEQLAKKATAARLKKFARDQRRLARAEQAASKATRMARAMGAVKFVFFAYDVYEALDEARGTFQQAE